MNSSPFPRFLVRTALSRPLVVYATTFGVGIGLGSVGISWSIAWFAGTTLLAAMTVLNRRSRTPVVAAGFLCAGAVRGLLFFPVDPSDVSRLTGTALVTVEGRVRSDPALRNDRWAVQIEAESFQRVGTGGRCSGSLIVRLPAANVAPAYGDRIAVRGRIEPPTPSTADGGFDYAQYLASKQIFAVLTAKHSTSWQITEPDGSLAGRVHHAAAAARQSLNRTLQTILPPSEAALLSGILVGAREDIPAEVEDDFASTGTVHILATAGLHVGLLVGILRTIFHWLRLRRRPAAFAAIAVLLFYSVVAGGRPSVVRAVWMAACYLLAEVLNREPDLPCALAAAAFGLLCVEPGVLFNPGFQLSIATVGTIIAVMPLLEKAKTRKYAWQPGAARRHGLTLQIRDFVLGVMAVSVAAQVGSAPLVAHYFNQVSLAGIAANALIVPLLQIVMFAGFAVWLVGPASPVLVLGAAGAALHAALLYFMFIARLFARVPGGLINVPSPSWLWIGLYYAILAIALGFVHWRIAPLPPILEPSTEVDTSATTIAEAARA